MGLKHSSAPFEGIPHNLARSISSRMHIPLLVTHVWVKIFKNSIIMIIICNQYLSMDGMPSSINIAMEAMAH